jgi:hypothetical protein
MSVRKFHFGSHFIDLDEIWYRKYVGWNFNFGNTALDWIQAQLE